MVLAATLIATTAAAAYGSLGAPDSLARRLKLGAARFVFDP